MALNKFWGPCDTEKYLHKMSVPMVQEAVMISGMPEAVINRIWEKEKPSKASFTWTKTETKRI